MDRSMAEARRRVLIEPEFNAAVFMAMRERCGEDPMTERCLKEMEHPRLRIVVEGWILDEVRGEFVAIGINHIAGIKPEFLKEFDDAMLRETILGSQPTIHNYHYTGAVPVLWPKRNPSR